MVCFRLLRHVAHLDSEYTTNMRHAGSIDTVSTTINLPRPDDDALVSPRTLPSHFIVAAWASTFRLVFCLSP